MPEQFYHTAAADDPVHGVDELNDTAELIATLASRLLGACLEALKCSAAIQTASSSVIALEAEARAALLGLLEAPVEFGADPSDLRAERDEAGDEDAWRGALREALEADIGRSLSKDPPEWLTGRANDMARTLAIAIVDMASDLDSRMNVMRVAARGIGAQEARGLNDIRRRFELSDAAFHDVLAAARRALNEQHTSVSTRTSRWRTRT